MKFAGSFNGIIILLLLVLAFIKSAKDAKKKNQTSGEETPSIGDELREVFREIMDSHRSKPIPVPPPAHPAEPSHTKPSYSMTPTPFKAEPMGQEFVSSISQVTDFEKESSLKGYIKSEEMTRMVADLTTSREPHPIIDDLMGENREEEFRKAIIYSEILTRKY